MPDDRQQYADDASTRALLRGLNSDDPGPAWSDFIDRYAPLVMRAARQFDYEQDRSGECFLYVCEGLTDKGFRRLLRYDPNGMARFETWLGTVVFNLCVDWHRKEFGRASLLPAIAALPAFDQAVYEHRFVQGLPLEACFQLLGEEFPDLSRDQLASAICRVHGVLTPRQRWQLSVRIQRKQGEENADTLLDQGAGPEEQTAEAEQRQHLDKAMAQLEPDQRLVLRLRYTQGLPLREVARLLQLGDPFRARRQVQAALDALEIRLLEGLEGRQRKN